MSLLNLYNDGLPNVLLALVLALQRARKGLAADELLAQVAPDGVAHENGRMARVTLHRWLELGLFKEADGAIRMATPVAMEIENVSGGIRAVREAARACVLSEINNPDLWTQKQARAADLTRSLAWLLAQNVYTFNFTHIEMLEANQIADIEDRLIVNDTRRNGIKYWAHFLGFVREPGGGGIDPTVAVRECLDQCLAPGAEVPAALFVEQLAAILPVLDGGHWRRAVEERLDRQALPRLAEGQISTALSRALLQLHLEEVLRFDNPSDVGSGIELTGRDGGRPQYRFSRVRRPISKQSPA